MSLIVTIYLFAFLFGSAIGSFLNVVIYRVPLGISLVHPPSRCPHCETPITWYWNIPILGWLALRGRCRACKARISVRYPIVELLTGLLALAVVFVHGLTPWALFIFVFVAALVAITFIDIDHMIIPDVISLPGIVVGLAGQAFIPGGRIIPAAIAVLAGGGGFFLIAWGFEKIRGIEGLGGGDIKLLAMIGAFTSPLGVLQTILVGSLTGSLIGGIYMLKSGQGGGLRIPFGPFLAFGALTAVLIPEAMDYFLALLVVPRD